MTVQRLGPAFTVLVAIVVGVAFLSAAASAEAIYKKPKTGTWKAPSYFDHVKGGSMKIAKKGKKNLVVKKLVLSLGSYQKDASRCNADKIKLRKPVTIKKFNKTSGRYAIGTLKKRLIEVQGGIKLKVGKKNVKGKMKMLFDESGTIATTAQIVAGKSCSVPFYVRK